MNKLSNEDKAHNSNIKAGIDVLTACLERHKDRRLNFVKDISVYMNGTSEVRKARVIAAKEDIRLIDLLVEQIENCKKLLSTLIKEKVGK